MSSAPESPRRNVLKHDLPESLLADRRPWHLIVSSRLGRDLISKQPHLSMTRRFVEHAARRGDGELIVRKTASQKWAERACELITVDAVRIDASEPQATREKSWHKVHLPEGSCRDQLAIELADRIDATFVRTGGTILRLLRQRLEADSHPSVQVLITGTDDKAAKELITHGAIGYWINVEASSNHDSQLNNQGLGLSTIRLNEPSVLNSLLKQPDRWLIHSTRQRSGPWPGQSTQQFEDWLLLSNPSRYLPSPLETLNRILSERRIIGSHATVPVDRAVVSFTSMPIDRWFARRAYRPHLGRWDCEPFGIAIDRIAAERRGVKPVSYGDSLQASGLSLDEAWRFQASGSTYDWREEQEWRAKGFVDLSLFGSNEVIVFVREPSDANELTTGFWPVVSSDQFRALEPH